MTYKIVENAKNVWIRDNADTMDLSPLTDASSVYLANGRSVEQELGEGSMVSNIVTMDKSMEKVVEGTHDGAFESGILKGRSLVNLMIECMNETLIQYTYPISSPNVANVSMLKPNTEYTLFYKAKYQVEGDTGTLHICTTENRSEDKSVAQHFTTQYNQYVFKFTTLSTVDYFTLRSNGHYFHIKECVLVEGDYTNIDLPFFEGICDVKMPILRNIGKNLFDVSTWKSDKGLQLINNGDGYTIAGSRGWFVIPVKVGEKYSLTYKGNNSANSDYALELYETNNSNSTPYGEWDLLAVNRFKTPNSVSEISPFTYTAKKKYLIAFHGSSERQLNLYDLQLEESSTATTYEDYKTNILHTSEEIVLREVGGVCDTYNVLTGEYVKRIGEIVFDGSSDENWQLHDNTGVSTARYYFGRAVADAKPISEDGGISDKIPYKRIYGVDEVGVVLTRESGHCYIRSTIRTLDEFKVWLQSNPITVQYELAEPVVTIIEPNTIPFAYENGHIILSSGYEGQSLLPVLEYSTVVGRTGQIQSIAKMTRRHEEKLNMLEQMLVQSILSMDYENTLLALNLEMDEVM